ncbi:DUF1624 domain-containing protein [Microvirga pudoricolor]|uniref:DUF1624 domain-containing protein n=1 Tax=Microvirga pudoricolor TaxID=2778729 RepID=UPI0019508847|nr:heparan-alpha-glucosaminide N-acetyltransferase [Microvirga pudoricolor]MBM6595642.1 DUF1624 domain-containing protein [Microvirga pudoricolor]
MTSTATNRAIPSRRWDGIDIARGIAICAMVVYHFGWDLSYLRLIPVDLIQDPAWRWFARTIAGSFLILVGVGLTMAHANGFRGWAFLKRLAKIAGAAALVTIATYLAFPESYIFFGILHCIALSSVLALPFLRLPAWIAAVSALLCLSLPWIATAPLWDRPWLDWLGLGASEPVTNDYVPVFPWFGLVLIGIVIGRALLLPRNAAPTAPVGAKGPGTRALVWAGRKSLPIYLIHQLVLFGALYGVLQLVGPNRTAEAQPFIQQCEANCLTSNSNVRVCRSVCSCVVDRLREDDTWRKVMAGTVGPDDQTRISRTAQQCLRSVPPA